MTWSGRVRISPTNGAQRTYDLDALPAMVVGYSLSYRPELLHRTTVKRQIQPASLGFRPVVRLTFHTEDQAVQSVLSDIVGALIERRQVVVVSLSLNAGALYRAVALSGYRGPTPIGQKTVAGAVYELELSCVETIQEVPQMRIGEQIVNGDFEQYLAGWTSAGSPSWADNQQEPVGGLVDAVCISGTPPQDSTLTSDVVLTRQGGTYILTYRYRPGIGGPNVAQAGDLRVEIDANDGNWTEIKRHPDDLTTAVMESVVAIVASGTQMRLRFRVGQAVGIDSGIWHVDDVSLRGTAPW